MPVKMPSKTTMGPDDDNRVTAEGAGAYLTQLIRDLAARGELQGDMIEGELRFWKKDIFDYLIKNVARMMTAEEVAYLLGFTDARVVHNLVKNMELVGYKIAGEWRFWWKDVDNYIKRQRYRHNGHKGGGGD